MKRLSFIALALLMIGSACAADKVLEASAKRKPAWLAGEEGCIIVSAEASSVKRVQENLVKQLQQAVFDSVASRVDKTATLTIRDIDTKGVWSEPRELTYALTVTPADIPFIATITMPEEVYWTHMRRDNWTEYYRYVVKFPFSGEQLQALVDTYNNTQREYRDRIQKYLSADFATYTSIEQMQASQSELNRLALSFDETNPCRAICDAARANYMNMMNTVKVKALSSSRQELVIALCYGDKQLGTNVQPTAESNCMTDIQITKQGNSHRITYNYAQCSPSERNYIVVNYVIRGRTFTGRFYIQ